MKKKFYAIFAIAALGMVSCGGSEENVEQEVKAAPAEKEYTLLTEESSLSWKGGWIVPGEDGEMMEVKNHNGTVRFAEGSVTTNADGVTGVFVIDMSTISSDDLADEPEEKEKLEGHLMADDFFKVEDFPNVAVSLNSITNGVADVTINVIGVEINKQFAVDMSEEGSKRHMHAEFSVDFSALGMPMTMANPEKPEEGNVNPEVDFHLHLTAVEKE